MTLQEFNSKYHYQLDIDKFGIEDMWEVMEPDSDGIYRGDCESYCLTLKYKVDGFKDLEIWTYTSQDNKSGHCIGKLDNRYIDCNVKELVDMNHPLLSMSWWKSPVQHSGFGLLKKMTYSKLLIKLPTGTRKSIYGWVNDN